MNKVNHPFWVIVNKEISDHVKSWRFIILIGIIALTCMGSLYTALTNISEAIKPNDPDGSFLFLKLFTVSDGTLPSFVLFINFLGPLLGIALGFDAVNSEQNKGTLSRMLSQPIHVWLFFSVFYTMIVNLVAKGLSPSQMASPYQIISYQKFILGLMRLAPSELFNEATTTLLMPSVRSLGPLTMEQVQGAIPSPLPLGQSLLVVWPQLTGLIAATVICFAISYIMFMRREIRSR